MVTDAMRSSGHGSVSARDNPFEMVTYSSLGLSNRIGVCNCELLVFALSQTVLARRVQ